MPDSKYRFIYNCDANNTFIYDEPPMKPADVNKYVDELIGWGLTTLLMSVHCGQDMNYDGVHGELVGSHASPEQEARILDPEVAKSGTTERAIQNYRALIADGYDPLGLTLDRAKEKGLETFITFRPNEVHCVEDPDSIVLSRFWKDHPQYHIGTPGDPLPPLYTEIMGTASPIVHTWIPGGLDFAEPEVREMTLAQIRELCERYDLDGLDMDFQRFPVYFRFGQEDAGIPIMTEFMRQVRATTNEVGEKRGRPMLLSVRTMSKMYQNNGIGIDPVAWAKEGLFDFVIVSHYLRNEYELPIAEHLAAYPDDMPFYASIEFERDTDRYREIARKLWSDGVDGLQMFNFPAAREGDTQPPFEVLPELADREKMLGGK
jgi:hypothetical protein